MQQPVRQKSEKYLQSAYDPRSQPGISLYAESKCIVKGFLGRLGEIREQVVDIVQNDDLQKRFWVGASQAVVFHYEKLQIDLSK